MVVMEMTRIGRSPQTFAGRRWWDFFWHGGRTPAAPFAHPVSDFAENTLLNRNTHGSNTKKECIEDKHYHSSTDDPFDVSPGLPIFYH